MNTRYITLSAGTSNVMTTSVTTMLFIVEIMSTLKAIKSSYDKQSWSFHMKFIKLAEGSFDKFHMK